MAYKVIIHISETNDDRFFLISLSFKTLFGFVKECLKCSLWRFPNFPENGERSFNLETGISPFNRLCSSYRFRDPNTCITNLDHTLLYNKGEKDDAEGGVFNRTRAIWTVFYKTNWNYLPNFTQINTQCLKRFCVYITTFDAAKVWPVSRIVTGWQLIKFLGLGVEWIWFIVNCKFVFALSCNKVDVFIL